MAVFTELARRGLQHPNAVAFVKRAVATHTGEEGHTKMPTWGAVLVSVSIWAMVTFIILVSYMLQDLIPTLAMVETPLAAITVSPSTHESGAKEEREGLLEDGPAITLVHQKPITSKIRGTIKHLVANAGRWARFRGLRVHIVYGLIFGLVAQVISAILPRIPGQPILVTGLAGALLANLHASWTHKVVSMPSEKSFLQRMPPKSAWKTLALPAAIKSAMPYISLYLTYGFGFLMGLHKEQNAREYNGAQWAFLIVRIIAFFVFAISCTLFLCMPAVVTLIRIEASILPEDEDTIVPFDRTFGGKVVSKMLGGTGVVSFLDAWRSFNWEARRRLIKLYVKTFFITVGMIIIAFQVLALEAYLVMGPGLGKFLSEHKHDGFGAK